MKKSYTLSLTEENVNKTKMKLKKNSQKLSPLVDNYLYDYSKDYDEEEQEL